jgi:hypothetical protein
MADSKTLKYADARADQFGKDLDKVLRELDRRIIDILNGATAGGEVEAALILNSRPEMIQALRDAGYYELAAEHAASYEGAVDALNEAFKDRKLPAPKFSGADVTTMKQLAAADIEGLTVIGESAIDELRLSLYRNAVGGSSFPDLVAMVAEKLEGPLRNHAYTYANTAQLNFSGEILKQAGESLGAEYWEVVGPLDEVTRDVCVDALADPVRTQNQWESADYFGGTPGGWNCRHQLYPVV